MKRYILLIGAILLNFALQAQSEAYMCRYWFDQNHMQATTSAFSESTWQAEIDIGSLSEGLHTLSLQLCDTSLVWNMPKSYLFYKVLSSQPALTYHYWFDDGIAQRQSGNIGNNGLLLDVEALDEGLHLLHIMLKGDAFSVPRSYLFYKVAHQQEEYNVIYRCWFDQDVSGLQSNMLENGHFLLDVSDLENGIHTVNIALQKNQILYSTKNYMFLKVETMQEDSIDLDHLVYHCWFDQDIEHRQTDSLQDGHLLLDVDGLAEGLHTVNIMLESSTLNVPKSYMFMKLAVQDPAAEMHYRCWFDKDYSNLQTGLVGNGVFELEVDGLSNGIHTVSFQLDNGSSSVPKSYMFYKKPNDGYIAKWSYWLNDDLSNRHTTNLSPFVDTLGIITLLPLESWPIRSTCFHFQPNGDEPYLNAKNEITFRFWDAEYHTMDKSTFYVDENVSEPIVADSLERNTTICINAPRDNTIKWYKLPLQFGDSVAFMAEKACTMQLFSPSGEEVYSAKASEVLAFGGCHAFEDGMYYLAIHDVTGSGEMISITYNWVYRYSILAYDVHLVGNGGCSTITFQGNGFNSLLDAYLVNAQNDTIRNLYIGHESNTTATVTFDFYQVNLGVYNAVFQFYDEAMHINGAMEVQEPTDILLTSSVSYPSVFLKGTTVTYSYTITNNGNMSAYGIPLYLYISSPTLESITHLELEGLGLFSLADYLNLDSIPYDYVEIINEWANNQGDDHYFYSFSEVENKQGDTVAVRSNFFFVNLAPFESKTIKLKITASIEVNQSIEVLMTVPNDIITPYTTTLNRETGKFCCVMQHITCFTSILAAEANSIGFWVDALSLAFPEIIEFTLLYHAASCIVSLVHAFAETVDAVFCNEEQGILNKIMWSLNQSNQSLIAMALNCLPSFQNLETAANALNPYAFNDLFDHSIYAIGDIVRGKLSETNIDCGFTEETIDCFQGTPQGGKSKAVNSLDPNDILGYLSESGSHYMRPEIQNVQYEIEFENDTTLATAAAHTIIVRDTLDATKFDLNSLAARSVTIGDKRLDLNGEQTFAKTLDLRPEIYVIAQVEQDYDLTTGIIQWTIQSLDPMTMEPTDDPNQGVLPVNYYGDGVGFIDYSVDLKQAFDDGTEISNRAGIIFDQNEVIMTPVWTNIIDAVKPVSQIESVETVNDSLLFNFVSSDNRSGVWYHTLYYRNDSTQMEWQVKKPQITENSLMLYFDDFQTTEYLVMAADSAGNHEEKEMVAEYIYYYEGPGPVTQTDNLSAGWNWWSTYIEMNGANGLELLESGLGTNGLNIKSSNGNSVEYIPDWEMWWGDEIEVRNESMYEINVAQTGAVTVVGTQAIPGVHPVTLAPGWNWIGYPVNASLPTETALASLSPAEEDVIQSRSGYSMYWPDFGFWGDVEYMTPGSGYKYMSNNAQPQTLVYPSSRGKALAYKPKTVETRLEAMQHQYLMDIVAVAELEGEELEAGHYELIALSEGQPRGRASLRYCEPNGRHVAMLVVYGDASETLEFRLLDTESGKVYEGAERMDFKAEKVVGGLRKPFTMHFGNEQEDALALEGMFPNPAKAGETVYLNMLDTSVEEGASGIELYNALGERIPVSYTKGSPLSFKAPKAAGVYVVRLTSNGETYHGTLIVTQ